MCLSIDGVSHIINIEIEGDDAMVFYILMILFTMILFRKTERAFTQAPKLEIFFCLSWFLFYFLLAMMSMQFELQLVNEISNWLFFVLFPLLITARLRKESLKKTLLEIGIKRFDKKTGLKTLLVCLIYIVIVFTMFSAGEETDITIEDIPKIVAYLPLFWILMILTAGFTEEFFFRGVLQRCMMNALKRPCTAILISSILFGLYHFPFAFYLWEGVSGSVIDSLKMILTEHVAAGIAHGLLYDKTSKNLWSSILLHSLSNAAIMALGIGALR